MREQRFFFCFFGNRIPSSKKWRFEETNFPSGFSLAFQTNFLNFSLLAIFLFNFAQKFLNLFIIKTFSASGCPIANRNKMRVLENGGTIEQHKAAVAVATAMKFDGVNCPTPGCDGKRASIHCVTHFLRGWKGWKEGVEGLESLTSWQLKYSKPKHPLATKRNGKHEAPRKLSRYAIHGRFLTFHSYN